MLSVILSQTTRVLTVISTNDSQHLINDTSIYTVITNMQIY